MSHPLLTKELMLAEVVDDEVIETLVAAMPHADRLEAALDVCQYLMADPRGGPPFRCALPERSHGVGLMDSHPFVPLVQP